MSHRPEHCNIIEGTVYGYHNSSSRYLVTRVLDRRVECEAYDGDRFVCKGVVIGTGELRELLSDGILFPLEPEFL